VTKLTLTETSGHINKKILVQWCVILTMASCQIGNNRAQVSHVKLCQVWAEAVFTEEVVAIRLNSTK
jgi:hypothetical protein